jgi:predicted short-subunit dehydrogenase-like oxidoreductase (DUF2520 family)
VDVAVVGAGRVGTAIAVLLRRAGHRIVAVAGGPGTPARAARHLPGVPATDGPNAAREAGVVLIGTPDGAISAVCEELALSGALGTGQWAIHLSGATRLDALAPARSAGAGILSVHPLQSCPSVEAALARLPGARFAVTAEDEDGFELGEELARGAGGDPFRLADDAKPLYHAAAVFASNYLVTLTALAAELEQRAGVPDGLGALLPLQRATLENVDALGPGDALTGPAVRGDAGTVEANLEALAKQAPKAVAAYVTLAELALDLAEDAGRLSAQARRAVEEVLERWR